MEPDLLPRDVALAKLADAFAAPETPAIRADRDDPALDRSAMDGAALRSQDGLVPRVILGTLYAGDPPDGFDVLPGTCVRIMTGACLPPGADTIVPVEELRQDAGGLVPLTLPRPGDHLRRQGEQARTGDLLLPAGWRGPARRVSPPLTSATPRRPPARRAAPIEPRPNSPLPRATVRTPTKIGKFAPKRSSDAPATIAKPA